MRIARRLCVALVAATSVHAQFFQQFFGGRGMQQESEPTEVGDASWFQERVANGAYLLTAQCKKYLCPDTLACVDAPVACPCPFKEQVRCMIGDTPLCIQSATCETVEALYQGS